MNTQCYRVIFSKTLQRLVVVSELSKTAGKGNTLSSGNFSVSPKFAKIRPLFFSLSCALGFVTISNNVLADLRIQSDPSANANQRPVVLETANGIPQVNIQTPNNKGLSHNRYQSFDVNTKGAILNNSRKNTATQLGGMVQGNPYLATGEAKVILNEVNSNRPSELKGYVEVAGKKADVIIANPSGLHCEGCGIINAERATLTTGKPEIQNGELNSFNVKKGKVKISGQGFDASRVDYADIIARETEINAGVWAKKRINITTGKNRVFKNNDSIEILHGSDKAATVSGYAVDVSALGGMYAEKIYLIGTEAGMGVRNAGHIGASAGQAVINSQGKIINSGTVNANQSVQLTAKSAVENSGILDSKQQHIQITTQGDISQDGTVIARKGEVKLKSSKTISQNGATLAQGNIGYQAKSIQAATDSTIAAGIKDDLTLNSRSDSGKNIILTATENVSAKGNNLASNRLSATGKTVDLSQSRTTMNHISLTAKEGKVNLANSRITAQQTFSANTPVALSTRSAQINAEKLKLNAPKLDNSQGTLISRNTNALNLSMPNGITNTQGQIYSAGDLTIDTHILQNQQGKVLANHIRLTTQQGELNNTQGIIQAQNTLQADSGELINTQGVLRSVGDMRLNMHGNDLINNQTKNTENNQGIIALGNLTMIANNIDNNAGFIAANGNTRLSASRLDNTGGTVYSSLATALSITDDLQNDRGQIQSGELNVNADTISQTNGSISVSGNAKIVAHTVDSLHNSTINAADLMVKTHRFSNKDSHITTTNNLTLSANTPVNNQNGQILSNGTQQLNVRALDNTNGTISANHNGIFSVTEQLTNNNGTLQSGKTLVISAALLSQKTGTISAAQTQITAQTVSSTANSEISGNQLTVTANQLDNSRSKLLADGQAGIKITDNINNQNGSIAALNAALSIQSATLDNRNGTLLGQSTEINANDIQNTDGGLFSKSDLTVNTQGLNNTNGAVVAQNALDVEAQTIINRNGSIGANIQSATLNVSDSMQNTQGEIFAGDKVLLKTTALFNQNGSITASGNTVINANTLDNTRQGNIISQSNLTLQASTIDNQGGVIQGKNTAIHTTQLNNNATNNTGSLISATQLLAINAKLIENRNTNATSTTPTQGLQATDIELTADTLNNRQGGIYARNTANARLNGSLDNTRGEMLAGNNLTVNQTGKQLIVNNQDGKLQANKNVVINAKDISHQGNITTAGHATIALQNDYTLNKAFDVGNLTFSTQGNFTNAVKQVVGNALSITAKNIDNRAGAEISSKSTALYTGTLTNRGLIDGTENVIKAETVNNLGSGRIYGDHLAIQAKQINNNAETVNNGTNAGTIAARERLDLGVGTLINRDHALILSLNEMAIRGALNAANQAIGKATLIDNGSATIEALGDGDINTAKLFNHDLYLQTGVDETSEYVHEMALTNDSQRYRVGVDGTFDWGGRNAWFDFYEEGRETLNQKEWYGWKYNRTTQATRIDYQDPGLITIGGNLTLNGNNLHNQYSKLLVGKTLTLGDTEYTQNADNGNLSTGNVTLTNEDLKQQINITDVGYSYFLQHYKKHGHNGHRETNETDFDIKQPTLEKDFNLVQNVIGNTTTIRESATNQTIGTQSNASAAALTKVTLGTVNTTVNNYQISNNGLSVGSPMITTVQGGSAATQLGESAITIKTYSPVITLPQASLYKVNPAVNNHYLVETDPQFTDAKQWLSSDYMFNALRYDSNSMQKRIGDGYYEQRLVNEQINNLTGYRYLAGYQSDYEQYKALMNSGIKYAKQFNLTVGVALTEAQMKELTTDLVWFVNREVTLADGSTTTVLAPQVYLVARNADITAAGGLISANSIVAATSGDIENSGVIAGRNLASLSAANISNRGGTLKSQNLLLNATQNITNLGGQLLADSTLVAKAKNINIASTTAENVDDGNFYQKVTNQIANVNVSGNNGLLVLQSEDDITVKGANMTVNGATIINAGGNLTLSTLETVNKEHYTANSDNYYHLDQTKEVGNNLTLNGNATLQAGNNITVRNSNITAEKQLNMISTGGNVTIESGRDTENLSTARKWTSHGTLSKTTSVYKYEHDYDTAVGSNISGENIIFSAQNGNVAVTGSSIVADDALAIQAGQNLTVSADTNTVKTYEYSESKKSGLMGSGGIGFTIGTKKQSDEYKTYAITQNDARSAIGSLNSDISLVSGNNVTVIGSDIIVPENSTLAVQAKSLSVEAGKDIISTDETHIVKQSGLTIALSTPVTDSLLAARDSIKRGSQVSNDKLTALYAVKAATEVAMASKNVSAVADTLSNMTNATYDKSAAGNANVKVSVSVGSSQSQNESHTQQVTNSGSTLSAGNITLKTTAGDLNVVGSNITATNQVILDSARDINLTATQDTYSNNSTNKNSGWSVGVFVGYNGNSYGLGLEASGQVGKGKENSDGATQVNTVVNGKNVSINSRNDTTLRGAVVNATQLVADIGNNLTIESVQDISHYDSKQTQAGASVSLAYGSSGGSVSFSRDKAKMNSAQVNEQSGFNVSEGGMNVTVANNTHLKGGLVQSTATADKNSFTTGTLTTENIENFSEVDVQSTGGSLSSGGINPLTAATTIMSALNSVDENSRTTTQSAVGNNINLTVKNGEIPTALSRDTGNANNKVAHYDIQAIKEKVGENAEMATVIGQISNNMINLAWKDKLDEAEAKKAQAQAVINSTTDADEKRAAQQALDSANGVIEKYGQGGSYQMAVRAVTGVLQGLASGKAELAVVGGLSPYANLAIKEATTDKNGEMNTAANIMAHAVLGAIEAKVSGSNVAAGAVAGGGGELMANVIAQTMYGVDGKTTKVEDLTEAQKDTITALSQIAGGLAGGLIGDSTQSAVVSSEISKRAVENNALFPSDIHKALTEMIQAVKEEKSVDQVIEKWKAISEKQREELINNCGIDCRVVTTRILNRSDEMADEYSGFVSAIISGLSYEEQQKLYDLVTTENQITRQSLEKQKTASEHALELILDTAALFRAENAVISSANKSSFAAKTTKSKVAQNTEKGSAIPYPNPEPVEFGNIKVTYKSNSKHTKGMQGNRSNAGIEPRNSLELFKNSVEYKVESNKITRYAKDSEGNIHRFFGTNGEYHWSGSSGDKNNPLPIPKDLKFK